MLIFIGGLLICLFNHIALAYNVSANKIISKNYQDYSTITISYDKYFPYKKNFDNKSVQGCIKIYTKKTILKCKEYIILNRPIALINKWRKTQRIKGYLPLNMTGLKIFNKIGRITSVRPAPKLSEHFISKKNNDSFLVTGKFIHHSTSVNQYTFINEKNGKIDNVHATDKHPFYLKNKKTFVPVKQIHSKDTLIDKDGNNIHLMHYLNNEHGKSTDTMPTVVYNIEVSIAHTYFVGRQKILVHNGCSKRKYLEHLKDKRLLRKKSDGSVYLECTKDELDVLYIPDHDGDLIEQYAEKKASSLPNRIVLRLHGLGFERKRSRSDNILLWMTAKKLSTFMLDRLVPFMVGQHAERIDYETVANNVITCAYAKYFGTLPEYSMEGGIPLQEQIYLEMPFLPRLVSWP